MALTKRSWAEVLEYGWPDASWSIRDPDLLSSLSWDGPGKAPTVEEIEALAERAWLAVAGAHAMAEIDGQAEAERLVHITGGSGQAMVYLEKQREARAVAGLIALGEAPEGSEFPLLSAAIGVDVDPRGGRSIDTLGQASEVILLIAAGWAATAAAIEGRRLRAKRAVSAAGSVGEIEAAMAAEGWKAP